MDKLRLEIRAMDEVNGKAQNVVRTIKLLSKSINDLLFPLVQIQPDLRELMETMNRMSNMPPDFEAKDKVSLW